MKYEYAKNLLQLNENFKENELKKQYRLLALQNHPDKNNNSEESKVKFQEINEAYLLLSKNTDTNFKDSCSYKDLFMDYLQHQLNLDDSNTLNLIWNLLENCQQFSLKMLENLNNSEYFNFIFLFLKQNKNTFHLDENFIEKLNEIYNKYQDKKYTINVLPTLNDLYEHNIIKIEHEQQTYHVPSWCQEVIFDKDKDKEQKTELIINILPNIPSHLSIDNNNNIIINIKASITSLLEKDNLAIHIDKKTINILTKEIKIQKLQKFIFKKQGIPVIDLYNIYNDNNISDLFVYLTLY